MVYVFDPQDWNGTSFLLDEYHMKGNYSEFVRANKPIPSSYFPESLTVVDASQELPDMFHTSRGLIVFSERARALMEERAPGQVEFIPVALHAAPKIEDQLNLASSYYFINVLGRAQRLLWLEMPLERFPTREDGAEIFGARPGWRNWKLREKADGEPLIWHDSPWLIENRRYSAHSRIFVEDGLWRELDSRFPDQIHPERVGQ